MRILIIKTSSLGDVVHTLPAITDLCKYYNNKSKLALTSDLIIDWVLEETFIDIPTNHPGVNNIIPVAIRKWRKNIFQHRKEIVKFIKNLRANKYDYIIDAQGLLKSAAITLLAKKNKIHNKIHGLDKYSSRGKYISWAYDEKYNISKELHAILRLKLLFSKVFNYEYNDNIDHGLVNYNNKFNIINNKYLVFLHCTTWDSKKWPVQYWQDLIKLAIDHGYEVKLNSGNQQEFKQACYIAKIFNNTEYQAKIHIMQPQSISSLFNILSNSAGIISVDTGLGHLAAALDKPGVAIYGSTSAKLTGIKSNNFDNIESSLECSPCLLKKCDKIKEDDFYPPCYKNITAQMVWQRLFTKI